MEMSKLEENRMRIQITLHNEGILKARAETGKPLSSELSGCVTVFKLPQIMVFNSAPLVVMVQANFTPHSLRLANDFVNRSKRCMLKYAPTPPVTESNDEHDH